MRLIPSRLSYLWVYILKQSNGFPFESFLLSVLTSCVRSLFQVPPPFCVLLLRSGMKLFILYKAVYCRLHENSHDGYLHRDKLLTDRTLYATSAIGLIASKCSAYESAYIALRNIASCTFILWLNIQCHRLDTAKDTIMRSRGEEGGERWEIAL